MTMPYRTPILSDPTMPRRRPQRPKTKRLTDRADLSGRAENVLIALDEYMQVHKISPSVRDLVSLCNISSTSVVNYYLDKLEGFGFIERQRNISRGIVITATGLKRLGKPEKKVMVICPHCHESFETVSV